MCYICSYVCIFVQEVFAITAALFSLLDCCRYSHYLKIFPCRFAYILLLKWEDKTKDTLFPFNIALFGTLASLFLCCLLLIFCSWRPWEVIILILYLFQNNLLFCSWEVNEYSVWVVSIHFLYSYRYYKLFRNYDLPYKSFLFWTVWFRAELRLPMYLVLMKQITAVLTEARCIIMTYLRFTLSFIQHKNNWDNGL